MKPEVLCTSFMKSHRVIFGIQFELYTEIFHCHSPLTKRFFILLVATNQYIFLQFSFTKKLVQQPKPSTGTNTNVTNKNKSFISYNEKPHLFEECGRSQLYEIPVLHKKSDNHKIRYSSFLGGPHRSRDGAHRERRALAICPRGEVSRRFALRRYAVNQCKNGIRYVSR